MSKTAILWGAALAAAGVTLTLPTAPVQAQARRAATVPERQLLGIRLGRPYSEVLRRFGTPDEVQTVALATGGAAAPGLGGAAGAGGSFGAPAGEFSAPSGFGAPGGGGGYPSGGGMSGGGYPSGGGMRGAVSGGGYPSGGGMGMPGGGYSGYPGASGGGGGYPSGGGGGIPTLPPGGGGAMTGMEMGGGASGPEYSTATLWIYKKPNNVRFEFLINEDGRVAQISVAKPANPTPFPAARTAKGITLGSSYQAVLERYGYPERTRMLAGGRFNEAYFSRNYHAAFTFDRQKQMKVVRVTIALAD